MKTWTGKELLAEYEEIQERISNIEDSIEICEMDYEDAVEEYRERLNNAEDENEQADIENDMERLELEHKAELEEYQAELEETKGKLSKLSGEFEYIRPKNVYTDKIGLEEYFREYYWEQYKDTIPHIIFDHIDWEGITKDAKIGMPSVEVNGEVYYEI